MTKFNPVPYLASHRSWQPPETKRTYGGLAKAMSPKKKAAEEEAEEAPEGADPPQVAEEGAAVEAQEASGKGTGPVGLCDNDHKPVPEAPADVATHQHPSFSNASADFLHGLFVDSAGTWSKNVAADGQ